MLEDNDQKTPHRPALDSTQEDKRLPSLSAFEQSCGSRREDATEAFHLDKNVLPEDQRRVDAAHSEGTGDAAQQQLGKFRLLRSVGSGGFGTVFEAEDSELQRKVAVKVPRRGRFTSQEEEERFIREARSVASLHHPGIVSVYDVGREHSLPFIVSEFVDGITLAEALDKRGFSFRESALLVVEIADALEHAHQHGIVHRDIKPSNIMLEGFGAADDHDGQSSQSTLRSSSVSSSRVSSSDLPRARLMDFGLARQVEDATSTTIEGTILGTPAYMSPEQARGEAHNVDGRTDIYSVGVILYEMLTEDLPFRGKLRMLINQILNDEPRPLRRLNDRIPRDLETIVLKCMSKTPSGRYDSAAELAADLRRFLDGKPIEARPVSNLERAWRWCRRNPAIAGMILVVLSSLIAGLSVATIGYVRTSRALEETRLAKQESDESFQEAIQAVEDLFTGVSENVLFNQPGMQEMRKKLLGRAKEYYARFAKRRQGDPSVRKELAMAHFRVGLITESIESPESALESYQTALDIQKLLCEANLDDTNAQQRLANTLSAMGRCHSRLNHHDEAKQAYDKSIEKRKHLAERRPDDVEIQRLLASAYMNRGLIEQDRNPQEALAWFEQAQDIRHRIIDNGQTSARLRKDLAFGYSNLVQPLLATGDMSGSQAALRNAIAAFEKIYTDHPEDLDGCYHLNLSRRILADHAAAQGNTDTASQFYHEARNGLEKLCGDNPAVVNYQAELARLSLNQAQLLFSQKKPKEALARANEATDILIKLTRHNPNQLQDRLDLITSAVLAAEIQRKQGLSDAAVATLEKLRNHLGALRKKVTEQDPELEKQCRQVSALIDKLMPKSPPP